MYGFVILCALIGCALAGTAPVNDDFYGRIVNGEPTTITAYPYQVSLQTNSNGHFCGGSIIDENTILTAAHCMQTYKASQFKVRLGSTYYNKGGEVVSVKAFKFHEGYNATSKVNDVAVVKMSSPVRQSSTVRYINLARNSPKSKTPAVVTGWGTTCFLLCPSLPTTLQRVFVDIVSEKDCASSKYNYNENEIQPTMVCAYATNKDACQGDSGGPLVANNELVGVVSWGRGCARNNLPGVYADVAALRPWILETAAALNR